MSPSWNAYPAGQRTFVDLVGHTITNVDATLGDEVLTLHLKDDTPCVLYYEQDCCASCVVEDIAGDLTDLLDTPILVAEASSSNENPPVATVDPAYQESFTWTFYRLTTIKGTVVIRWYGSSNGYYSESVTVAWADKAE